MVSDSAYSGSIKVATPEPDLHELSQCAATPTGVTEWIEQLPLVDTASTADALRELTAELARLRASCAERLALLEATRPTLHYLCARLDRSSISAHQQADALAWQAQRLQSNLCVGYKCVLRDAQFEVDGDRTIARDVLPLACHRTLSDLSRTLLRALQLYIPTADNLWLELNQLFALAERLEFATMPVEDPENHAATAALTVEQVYLRAVLVSTARPNQLRHRDLTLLFNALENWVQFSRMEAPSDQALFAVDLASDQPPMHSPRLTPTATSRGVRTDLLVYQLDAHRKSIAAEIEIPENFRPALLGHLVDAWGQHKARSFRRMPGAGTLKVCVGLRSTHYYLSGGVEFSEQISSADAMLKREINPFLDPPPASHASGDPGDPWNDAFDLRIRIPENPNIENPEKILAKHATLPSERDSSFLSHDAEILDSSPNGYRLRWPGERPHQLQAGELLALRDVSDPRWCIAVTRWLRQEEDATYLGVELLAPRAIAVAARVIQKRGGPTDFARALLLPELKPIGQPPLLITPSLPFQSGQKVHVQRQGIQTTAQLTECVLSTESFSQFSFRMLDGYLENAQIDLNMSADWDKDGDGSPPT